MQKKKKENKIARRLVQQENRARRRVKKARAERKRVSHRVRKGIKFALHILDPHCYYCRSRLSFELATLDHKQPLSRGGSNEPENIALCCRKCNEDKANQTEEEFRSKERTT